MSAEPIAEISILLGTKTDGSIVAAKKEVQALKTSANLTAISIDKLGERLALLSVPKEVEKDFTALGSASDKIATNLDRISTTLSSIGKSLPIDALKDLSSIVKELCSSTRSATRTPSTKSDSSSVASDSSQETPSQKRTRLSEERKAKNLVEKDAASKKREEKRVDRLAEKLAEKDAASKKREEKRANSLSDSSSVASDSSQETPSQKRTRLSEERKAKNLAEKEAASKKREGSRADRLTEKLAEKDAASKKREERRANSLIEKDRIANKKKTDSDERTRISKEKKSQYKNPYDSTVESFSSEKMGFFHDEAKAEDLARENYRIKEEGKNKKKTEQEKERSEKRLFRISDAKERFEEKESLKENIRKQRFVDSLLFNQKKESLKEKARKQKYSDELLFDKSKINSRLEYRNIIKKQKDHERDEKERSRRLSKLETAEGVGSVLRKVLPSLKVAAIAATLYGVVKSSLEYPMEMRKEYAKAYLSNSSVTGMRGTAFAGKGVGLTEETTEASVSNLAGNLLTNPGISALVASTIGVSLDRIHKMETTEIMTQTIAALHKQVRDGVIAPFVALQRAELFGIGGTTYRLLENNADKINKRREENIRIQNKYGVNPDDPRTKDVLGSLSDKLDLVKRNFQSFVESISIRLSPILLSIGDSLISAMDSYDRLWSYADSKWKDFGIWWKKFSMEDYFSPTLIKNTKEILNNISETGKELYHWAFPKGFIEYLREVRSTASTLWKDLFPEGFDSYMVSFTDRLLELGSKIRKKTIKESITDIGNGVWDDIISGIDLERKSILDLLGIKDPKKKGEEFKGMPGPSSNLHKESFRLQENQYKYERASSDWLEKIYAIFSKIIDSVPGNNRSNLIPVSYHPFHSSNNGGIGSSTGNAQTDSLFSSIENEFNLRHGSLAGIYENESSSGRDVRSGDNGRAIGPFQQHEEFASDNGVVNRNSLSDSARGTARFLRKFMNKSGENYSRAFDAYHRGEAGSNQPMTPSDKGYVDRVMQHMSAPVVPSRIGEETRLGAEGSLSGVSMHNNTTINVHGGESKAVAKEVYRSQDQLFNGLARNLRSQWA